MTINTMEVTSRSYAYELTDEDYRAVEKRDNDLAEQVFDAGGAWNYNKHCLSGVLDTLEGVSDTDYNGHFGPFIYFRIDADDDCDELRDTIHRTIQDWIAKG